MDPFAGPTMIRAEVMKPYKIKMEGERNRYTAQAWNDRFAILTKPFNAKRTYLYTIVDLERGVRGRCNLIFGLPGPVDTPEGAEAVLELLESGEMEVSHRHCVPLEPSEIKAFETLERNR